MSRSTLRTCLQIFLAALAVRAAWGTWGLLRQDDPTALEFPDEQQYWRMADSLWRGEGLLDELGFQATRMPLFPAVLAPFTAIENGTIVAKCSMWMLASLIPVLTFLLAEKLVPPSAAWLAAMLTCFDPFLIFFSSLLLTETLFCACLLATWTVAANIDGHTSWKRWVVLGVVAALTVHAREVAIGLIAMLLIWILWRQRVNKRVLLGSGIVAITILVSLLPWAMRNHRVLGEFRLLTTRGPISLYDGVRPRADGSSNLAGIQDAPEIRHLTEIQWSRHFLDLSIREIRNDPARVARLAVTKLSRMWNPLPNVNTYQSSVIRTVSVAWMAPVLIFAAVGACVLSTGKTGARTCPMVMLLIPAIGLTLVHCLFVGSVRYRIPAMPMLEILTAVGLLSVITRRRPTGSTETVTPSEPSAADG